MPSAKKPPTNPLTAQPATAAVGADTLPPIDPVTDLLGGGRVVAYRVDLALAVGSIGAGLLLSQFWFWTNSPTTEKRDGWFWMTCAQIAEQTGLSKEEQMTARKRLCKLGVLSEDKRGVPMKLWFRIEKPRLVELLRSYAEHISHLSAFPIDELLGIPTDGIPNSYLSGMPRDKVGQFRHIARGKANSLLSAFPEDITNTSSKISSPISLPSSPEAAQAPLETPAHKCAPRRGGSPETEREKVIMENELEELDDPAAFYWVRTLRRLRERVNTPTYGSHFLSLSVVSLNEAGSPEAENGLMTFNLTAESQFTRGWVRDRHLSTIRTALEEEMEQPVAVRIVGDAQQSKDQQVNRLVE